MSAGKTKCMRCGAEWPPNLPPPRVCPACRSAYWQNDVGVSGGPTYEITQISSLSDDSISMSLKAGGHMPNPVFDGRLYASLKARAQKLGVPIAQLTGWGIEFRREKDETVISKLEAPRKKP